MVEAAEMDILYNHIVIHILTRAVNFQSDRTMNRTRHMGILFLTNYSLFIIWEEQSSIKQYETARKPFSLKKGFVKIT